MIAAPPKQSVGADNIRPYRFCRMYVELLIKRRYNEENRRREELLWIFSRCES